MQRIRALIHQHIPGVREAFKWSRPVFILEKDFAYFKTTKNYLTLGFMNFRKINDPDGLLEGSGKDMRHIKLRDFNEVDDELLKKWFEAVTA